MLVRRLTYLVKFMPNLSTITAPLRMLLEQRNEWTWQHEQENCFQTSRKVYLPQSQYLSFMTQRGPQESQQMLHRLGKVRSFYSCMRKLVAYTSRPLTRAELNYALIGNQLLATKYACERFHQYIYRQYIKGRN